jgi:transitional endoplasmic reticulum ATPase
MSLMRRSSSRPLVHQISPLAHLWLLRLLVPLSGHREFVREQYFASDSLAEVLGLGHWIDPDAREFAPTKVRAELRRMHARAERELEGETVPTCLGKNVARVAELVGLSPADCRILELAVMLHGDGLLEDTADYLGQLSSVGVFQAVAILLDLPEAEIRTALNPNGTLARSGIVALERQSRGTLRYKFELLSDNFADYILSTEHDPVMLLRDTVSVAPAPELTLDDYAHIAPVLRVLEPYLEHALAARRKGVNIYVHGIPGTGKTQLARALAARFGCELFEVASQDTDGDPLQGSRRLQAYRAAQSFFAQRRALVAFDEAEDVFVDTSALPFHPKGAAQTSKGWMNRMLEENPVPTLWLSNSLGGVDPAFVRRLDLVFELPVPPSARRARMIEAACGDLVDARSITRMATSEVLAPAIVSRAAGIVRSIRDTLGEDGTADALDLLIGNTLSAQGHRPLLRDDPAALPPFYDPAFVNADADLDALANGLIEARMARLCFHGAPGTGKTAFARWLAERLDAPLHVQRASDLLSPYVGVAEKQIAMAFHRAAQQQAVLLIDEVDSFLQDRRGAHRSWEVSLVNEMLTQMEAFPGVFIASTNLMQGIDQAALRRFDLKVQFDYLRPQQAWQLLCRQCTAMGLAAPDTSLSSDVATLVNLTPGDFATVARQHRFRPLPDVESWIAALAAECGLKESARARIGFHCPEDNGIVPPGRRDEH